MQVELSQETRERIARLVESGSFATADEAVAAALDAWDSRAWSGEDQDVVRRKLVEGIEDSRAGRSRPLTSGTAAEVIASARSKRAGARSA
jgi:Arc/MetJ-type ribon-helix-helix transcriptional regulator